MDYLQESRVLASDNPHLPGVLPGEVWAAERVR